MNIASQPSKVNNQYNPSLADHWAAFLDKPEWRWALYGHFTFRDRNPDDKGLRKFVHPESGGKMWDVFIHTMNKEIFGNRYYKRKNDGVVWARATELQVRGALHYHAIIGRVRIDVDTSNARARTDTRATKRTKADALECCCWRVDAQVIDSQQRRSASAALGGAEQRRRRSALP